MQDEEVLAEFRASKALLEGHFLLSSGRHSAHYLQCARVLMNAERAGRLAHALATALPRELRRQITKVVSPAMGGVIIESGKFPWDNGKFPGMTEPSQGYHGVKFYETFGDFGFTMRCRMESLRVFGAALSPMSAWQILQGVETLPLRMERHLANTERKRHVSSSAQSSHLP